MPRINGSETRKSRRHHFLMLLGISGSFWGAVGAQRFQVLPMPCSAHRHCNGLMAEAPAPIDFYSGHDEAARESVRRAPRREPPAYCAAISYVDGTALISPDPGPVEYP